MFITKKLNGYEVILLLIVQVVLIPMKLSGVIKFDWVIILIPVWLVIALFLGIMLEVLLMIIKRRHERG